ncbi:MAG: type II secretion system protein GspK [Halioglobus sp.]
MPQTASSLAGKQDGVALAILVWFLAAMSLLVAGIVMQSRVDIKLAQLQATRARVEAAADGAIQLALAQLIQPPPAGEPVPPEAPSQTFSLGGYEVTVNFTPVSGLININDAPEGLLFLLFSTVADLDETAAHELATNVIEWRSANPSGDIAAEPPARSSGKDRVRNSRTTGSTAPGNERHGRFEAIEDLLLVSGIDRGVFEAVQSAVYVSQTGQAGVDWTSAPVDVLRGLMGGDEESARALAESRVDDKNEGLVAPDTIDLSFQEASALSAYRIDAVVEQDGSVFDRRRWVDLTVLALTDCPGVFLARRPCGPRSLATSEGSASGEE